MLRRSTCLAGLLLATGAARALASPAEPATDRSTAVVARGDAPSELALGEQQLVLPPTRDILDDSDTAPYARAAAFAQLTGGGADRGELGLGVAGAVSGLGCDFVSGAAQGRLRPVADHPIVGDARWELCVSKLAITTVFEGHHELGVAPAIDARHSLWRRRYDENYEKVTIGLGEIPSDDAGRRRHSVLMMSLGHGVTTQSDSIDNRRMASLDVDAAVYRYHRITDRAELVIDAVALTSDALKTGSDNKGAVTGSFLPVRARLDTPEWFVEGGAGWGLAGGQLTASSSTEVNGKTTSSWTETIDSAGLPQMVTLVGELGGGIHRAWGDASVTASRSFFPTFDGNVALEDRLAGAVSYRLGHHHPTTLSLSPFVAATRTWNRGGIRSFDPSAGASAHVSRDLNHMLRFDAIGEAGLSPYARLDGDRAPDSTLGGQLMLALSAHVAQ